MKKLLFLTSIFIYCFKIGFTQPGQSDSSFGKNGAVKIDLGSDKIFSGSACQILSLPDSGMYVVFETPFSGSAANAYSGKTLITKKLANGSLDSSYGNDGLSVSSPITAAHAVLQKDGKIVVAGAYRSTDDYETYWDQKYFENYDFALARYNTDGSLDLSFGINGLVTLSFPSYEDGQFNIYNSYYDGVTSLLIQDDGKILCTGFTPISGSDEYGDQVVIYEVMVMARFDTNGNPDNTFNGNGKLITSLRADDGALAAMQSGGKFVVAGSCSGGLTLARYNLDGTADNTFKVSDSLKKPDNSYFSAKSLAIQSDGKIVLGGLWQNSNSNKDFVLVRYNASGSLDKTFGKNGIQTTDFRTYDDIINSIIIQADGKIVAAGYASNGSNNAFAIARYNTNGSPDNTFDADGKKMNFIGLYDVYAVSVAVQNDGKLVAAGYNQNPVAANIATARYNANGSLDNTFNKTGASLDAFKQKNTIFTKNIIGKDGKVAATGYYDNGTTNTYFLAIYNVDGSPDNTFSEDGIVLTGYAFSDIKMQTDGKIVAAGTTSNGKNTDFILVRYNTDGSVDNTFSGDGKTTTDFGFEETAKSLMIQNDGKIVVAGSSNNTFALARYNTDGSLDNTFSGDGKQTTQFTNENGIAGSSEANAIAIQKNGKIVAAGTAYFDYAGNFAIARYNADGTLDKSFSQDGIQTTNADTFQIYYDYGALLTATSVSVQDDGKIIVAGDGGGYGRYEIFSFPLIARYNTDGSLDNTFSGKGWETIYFNAESRNTSIALQSNGKIVLQSNLYENDEYGYSNIYEVQKGFAITRLTANGSIDNTFGNGGMLYPLPDENIQIQNIVIANNKLSVAGYSEGVGNLGFLGRYLLTAPFVSITSPADKSVFAAPATITVKAAASDEDGTISSVKLYNGPTYLKTVTSSPYTFTIPNLPVGTYTLTAKATDNSGIQSVSKPVTVSVLPIASNKAPVVIITGPADNAVYGAPATFTINASASDPDGTISTVKFYKGGTLLGVDSTSPYSFIVKNAASGNYSYTAKATDNQGLSSSSASTAVAVAVPANKAPVVSITSPVNNVVYTAPATINIVAKAADADGAVNQIAFYNGSTNLGGIGSIYNIDTFTQTLTNVPPGNYSFTAKAIDDKNLKSSSATVTIQVVAPNKAPAVSAPVSVKVSNTSVTSIRLYLEKQKTALNDVLSMRLSPNPAGNIVNIYTNGLKQNKPATLSIISISGIVLKTINISNSATQLDVRSLAGGVYTIKIISADKVLYKQFVKL